MNSHPKVKFAAPPHTKQQLIIDHVTGKIKNEKTGKPYRIVIATIGRQWGKSWTGKRLAMEYSINRRGTVMWVAPTAAGAYEHWNELTQLIASSGIPYESMNSTRMEVHFRGGGSIRVRGAQKPNNLRGAALDLLVMDEAAFYPNGDDLFWEILLPMLTAKRGKAVFLTTPNGKNWYYKLIQKLTDKNSALSDITKVFHFPSSSSPVQDLEMLAALKTTMPSKKWKQEFLAKFLDDAGGVFYRAAVQSTMPVVTAPLPGHIYVMGIDIGKNNDVTAVTVIDKLTRAQVYGETFDNMGTIATVKRIVELLYEWTPEICHIEKNGVGEHLAGMVQAVLRGTAEDSILDLLDNPSPVNDTKIDDMYIRFVHMDNPTKRSMVERLATDIEYGRLKLLSAETTYGKLQSEELSTYEVQPTNSGMGITYNAAKGEHDDTVTALYLCYAGVPKVRPFKFKDVVNDKEVTVGRLFKSGVRLNHA